MALTASQSTPDRRAHRHDHIIDTLIEERAPKLSSTPIWPLLRPALYALLDYGKARRMADAIVDLPGRRALEFISRMLSVKLTVTGMQHVPASGRLVVICNHPTGIADGIAVYDSLKTVRPDLMFYANADAERVSPRFSEALIPVEWVEDKRTRERTRQTLVMTRELLEAEGVLVVFPAGRIARMGPGHKARDIPWMPTALSVARKYAAPVLPIHVAGPSPTLFHLFHRVSSELRDITLFHELLNKRGRKFRLTIGPLIAAGRLDADDMPALQAYVEEQLAADPAAPFG
jgi:putative hemolysin